MDAEQLAAEKRRRQRLNRQLLTVILIANVLGAFLATAFFSISSHVQGTSEPGEPFIYTGIFIVALIVVGSILGSLTSRPLARWYENPGTDLPLTPKVQRMALRSPLHSALVSLTMWSLAGILSAWSAASSGIGAMMTMFLGMAGIAGPVTALLIYFATERIWSREIPLFFPNSQPLDVRVFRLSMRRRLFVPSLVGLVLMLVMTVYVVGLAQEYPSLTPAMQAAQVQVLVYRQLFLWGIAILSAIALTLTLGHYMAGAVETLQRRMNEVQQGQLEARIPVTSNDEFGALAAGFNGMVEGLQQEAVIRRLFRLYVTPEVAEHAIRHGAELGGQSVEVTTLFSDIRGFTTLAERLGPEATIALLNRYFEVMSGVIAARGGLVNKFGGDSLLAIFGSPLNPTPDHARRAVQAAQGMLAALETLNENQRQRREPELGIGIGVATGPVVAGNVGSEERLEYTVIGDAVNLAARLQDMTRELGVSLLVSASTVAGLGDTAGLQPMGEVTVRGKQAPTPVYGGPEKNSRLLVV